MTPIVSDDAKALYRICETLGFYLLDGEEIVYFGIFDALSAKEVVFRVKLLLQSLNQALKLFENVQSKTMKPEDVDRLRSLKSRIKVEVLVSKEIDRLAANIRIEELTSEFHKFPWELLTPLDLQKKVDEEYESIGEI